MAQLVTSFLNKHEALSSDPLYPLKSGFGGTCLQLEC